MKNNRLLKWKTIGQKGTTELMEETVSKKSLRDIHKIVSMDVSYADTMTPLTLVGPHTEPADGERRLSDGDRCTATSYRFKP